MCYVIPILEDFYSKVRSDDRVARMRAALRGRRIGLQCLTSKDDFKNGKLSEGLKYETPKIDHAQPNKIIAMCRKGESITNIEKSLKEQGIIENP